MRLPAGARGEARRLSGGLLLGVVRMRPRPSPRRESGRGGVGPLERCREVRAARAAPRRGQAGLAAGGWAGGEARPARSAPAVSVRRRLC